MDMTRARPGLFGLATVLGGVGVLIGASGIQSGFSYDAVGPSLVPNIIGGGLVVSGLLAIVEAMREAPSEEMEGGPAHFVPVILISVALLLEALFVKVVGWVPMSALAFAITAYAFGDKRVVLSLVLGLVFGVATLFAFNMGLGLRLPLGILAPVFGGIF